MYKVAGGILIKMALPKMQRMPFDAVTAPRGIGLSGRSASIRAMPKRSPAPPPAPVARPTGASEVQKPTALATPYQSAPVQQPGSTGPIVPQPMTPPPGSTTGPIAPRSADFSKIKGRRPQVLGSGNMPTAGNMGKPTAQQTGAAGAGQGIIGTLGNWGNKALEFGRKDVSSLLPDSWTPGT